MRSFAGRNIHSFLVYTLTHKSTNPVSSPPSSYIYSSRAILPSKATGIAAAPISSSSSSLYLLCLSKGHKVPPVTSFPVRYLSVEANPRMIEKQILPAANKVQQMGFLSAVNDEYGGVIVDVKDPMDSSDFANKLSDSISQWKQQGKKGVWIKIPIQLVNLVEAAVKAGFWYHHAEPTYLMLVNWIPKTAHTLPANASHRVGIGAFVMNNKEEVLVVQERLGRFSGKKVWKFPTGAVDEGEDIHAAAIREVKEETGIETEFVEVLAFRQSHNSFFEKSDLFFVCMLKPLSFDIQKQDSEIEAAKWMPAEEYAAQPFVQQHEVFNCITNVCLTKKNNGYAGFSPVPKTTSSSKSKGGTTISLVDGISPPTACNNCSLCQYPCHPLPPPPPVGLESYGAPPPPAAGAGGNCPPVPAQCCQYPRPLPFHHPCL